MSNVRWEPVASGVVCRDDDSDMVCGVDGWLLWIRQAGRGGTVNIALPPDIRLCRAVPVTWSQEPPTEAGWWWRWSPPRGVELYLIEPELGDGPLWNATDPADDMMYPVSRTVSVPGIYWLPATVPQPPGEVGP